MKSDKMSCIIYTDMESSIKKIDRYVNNPENFSVTIGEHIACGYSMTTILAFNNTENKHTLYHIKDCMKTICESLRGYAKNIIDFERKECYR